jgi:hypothetical protein
LRTRRRRRRLQNVRADAEDAAARETSRPNCARGKYHGGRIGDEQGREDLRDDMVLFHCAKILTLFFIFSLKHLLEWD